MSQPMSLATLNEMFDHNYWARDRQLQACARLTEEQFLRPLGNSFPSLRDTLTHLLAVEWIWLERWRGRAPRVLLSPEEFPTLSALSQRWRTVEHEMREHVAGLSEEAIEWPMTCVSTRGQPWTYTLWRMILHLLNHQSYHRGQVTALLRQLGEQPPKVDFLDAHDMGFRLDS
ncbi:MAG: DinB family protein [Candidatus Solibacter sp.]|nr:DinB family protein [Candidatus Solibacter sp.]